eukprot:GFUD01020106.1.p1 GENE.GFUD01020106.1~~GFUD01020106.1.p1  ORF type:complete len:349 (-),score=99.52 GFUD01020106.1:8-1054(-)
MILIKHALILCMSVPLMPHVLIVKGEKYEKEVQIEDCVEGDDASWAIKKWILTEMDDLQKYQIKFYETVFSLVKDDNGPSWYIVSDGWQGAFYYETGEPGMERVGAYLYPDYSTAIVGVWRDHLLVSGRTTQLAEACRSGNVWTLKFGELEGPIMTYSPPTHYSYGVHPLQRDPYEVRTVEVKNSEEPGAQDGLFTTRDVMSGEVIAFYSGLIIYCESSLRALDRRELSDEEEHFRNMYNIALDIGEEDDNLCIDIPPDLGNDVKRYNATLGHKVNHSFRPNSEFVLFTAHPVLGTIMALTALEDMPARMEVSVNYGYNLTADADQPEWFKKLWREFYSESGSGHEEL